MYLFSRIGHFKKIILKVRGFRGGSDEKMRRMWFGLEIDVVGLPPLAWVKAVVGPYLLLELLDSSFILFSTELSSKNRFNFYLADFHGRNWRISGFYENETQH